MVGGWRNWKAKRQGSGPGQFPELLTASGPGANHFLALRLCLSLSAWWLPLGWPVVKLDEQSHLPETECCKVWSHYCRSWHHPGEILSGLPCSFFHECKLSLFFLLLFYFFILLFIIFLMFPNLHFSPFKKNDNLRIGFFQCSILFFLFWKRIVVLKRARVLLSEVQENHQRWAPAITASCACVSTETDTFVLKIYGRVSVPVKEHWNNSAATAWGWIWDDVGTTSPFVLTALLKHNYTP